MEQRNRYLRHLTRVLKPLPLDLLVRLSIVIFRIARLARRFFATAAVAPRGG